MAYHNPYFNSNYPVKPPVNEYVKQSGINKFLLLSVIVTVITLTVAGGALAYQMRSQSVSASKTSVAEKTTAKVKQKEHQEKQKVQPNKTVEGIKKLDVQNLVYPLSEECPEQIINYQTLVHRSLARMNNNQEEKYLIPLAPTMNTDGECWTKVVNGASKQNMTIPRLGTLPLIEIEPIEQSAVSIVSNGQKYVDLNHDGYLDVVVEGKTAAAAAADGLDGKEAWAIFYNSKDPLHPYIFSLPTSSKFKNGQIILTINRNYIETYRFFNQGDQLYVTSIEHGHVEE